jgi:hypothetical protein
VHERDSYMPKKFNYHDFVQAVTGAPDYAAAAGVLAQWAERLEALGEDAREAVLARVQDILLPNK